MHNRTWFFWESYCFKRRKFNFRNTSSFKWLSEKRNFFKLIVDIIKDYQRNGEGIEYYENGDLKYDGNFVNDEYDGNGIFHHNNNFIYVGSFKNWEKHGFGFAVKNDEIILKGIFENDKLIESHNNNSDDLNHFNIQNQSLNFNNDNINNIINIINYENNLSTNNNYNNVVYNNKNNFISNNYTTNNIILNKHKEEAFRNAPDVDNILLNEMKKDNENKNNNTFFKDFYKEYKYKGFRNDKFYHCDENERTRDDCLIF